jgi:hypothetical protein
LIAFLPRTTALIVTRLGYWRITNVQTIDKVNRR